MTTLQEVADSVCYWLRESHSLEAKAEIIGTDRIDIQITDEGEDFYIGNFADAGMALSELRNIGKPDNLADWVVKVNGIWMSALGKHIAGWAVGYE